MQIPTIKIIKVPTTMPGHILDEICKYSDCDETTCSECPFDSPESYAEFAQHVNKESDIDG
jgi:hypothetical protein